MNEKIIEKALKSDKIPQSVKQIIDRNQKIIRELRNQKSALILIELAYAKGLADGVYLTTPQKDEYGNQK